MQRYFIKYQKQVKYLDLMHLNTVCENDKGLILHSNL